MRNQEMVLFSSMTDSNRSAQNAMIWTSTRAVYVWFGRYDVNKSCTQAPSLTFYSRELYAK